MSNHNRIVSLNGDASEQPLAGDPQPIENAYEAPVDWTVEEEDARAQVHSGRGLIAPALAALAIFAWTAFFLWSRQSELLASAGPALWTQWISAWSGPVLLIAVFWLLAMRTSRREAARFGDAAQMLNRESAQLEARLTTVNRELSLAREFLASQSRDLESLGRMASDRLSQNADKLQSLIRDNSAQVDAIGSVSAAALENMERLRGQLPVLSGSAKDVTNNIANAGRTAHLQLQELINGFQRLNEFGQASERQALAVRGEVDSALGEFKLHAEAIDTLMAQRISALKAQSEQTRAELVEQENDALASWHKRVSDMDVQMRQVIAALDRVDEVSAQAGQHRIAEIQAAAAQLEAEITQKRADFDSEIARRNEIAEADHQTSLARMASIFAQFDCSAKERAERNRQHIEALANHADDLTEKMDALTERMSEIATTGDDSKNRVAAGVDALVARLDQTRASLAGTDKEIASLTDSSVRLLELIQAGVQHSSHDLPAALAIGEARLNEMEGRVAALVQNSDTARAHGESLSAYVLASEDGLNKTANRLAEVHEDFEARHRAQSERLTELSDALERLRLGSEQLAEEAQGQLSEAIAKLEGATRESLATMGDTATSQIHTMSTQLSDEAVKAVESILQERTEQAAGQLESAAAAAAQVSREAMLQLRDQLAKVNELAGNLERRVAHTRQRAEEQVDNDFSRRVALINESLNSNAIDIARALSADVADTAWSAYLKGDRGIFTRRAVSLLDNAETKAVAQLYEDDTSFRDHVSRFIHDFEAMLRQLLSTRDGHAIGVTLLSSDLGKLYVALAQAIERLRT